MRNTVKIAVVAALMACTGANIASAQTSTEDRHYPRPKANIHLVNENVDKNSIWYTLYLAGNSKVSWGCLVAGQNFLMPDLIIQQAERARGFYVRGEVKANHDCTGKTLRDSGMGAEHKVQGEDGLTLVHLN